MLFDFGNNFENSVRKEKNTTLLFPFYTLSQNEQHQIVWGRGQVMCAFMEFSKMLFGKEFANAPKGHLHFKNV